MSISEFKLKKKKKKKKKEKSHSGYSNKSLYRISAKSDNVAFLDQIARKEYFSSKAEKVNTTFEFCIFELVLVPNVSLNWQFIFFLKRVFPA